jgi:hypothetical protein
LINNKQEKRENKQILIGQGALVCGNWKLEDSGWYQH